MGTVDESERVSVCLRQSAEAAALENVTDLNKSVC